MAFESTPMHHEPGRRLKERSRLDALKSMVKTKKELVATKGGLFFAKPDKSSKKNAQTVQTIQIGTSAFILPGSHGLEPVLDQGSHPQQNKRIHSIDSAASEEGKLEAAATVHGSSSPRNSQIDGSDGTIPEDEGRSKDLWMHAYEILKIKDPELVTAYERHLTSDDASHTASTSPHLSPQLIASIIKPKLEERASKKLVLDLGKKSVKLREQGEKVIKFILWSTPFISECINARPFAALAWSGVSNLLSLMLDYPEQSQDMIEGLDEISDLLRLYKHKESVYLHGPDESAPPDLVKAIQELYVDIFEYQVRLICFLARKWSRIGIYGTMRLDYWKSMRKQIRDSNENFKKYGVALSEEKARLDYKNESSCIEQSVGIQKRVFDTFEASRTQRQKERRDNIEAQLLETLASDYKSDKDLVPARVPGTCEWFFEDERFLNWRSNKSLSLLWVSAGPGCGKSVLSRALIDERRVCSSFMTSSVYYFFFKDGQERRTHGAHALSAILHQLFETTNLISHAVPSYQNYGKTLRDNFSELWDLLIKSAKDQEAGEIICILDALDECEENKRNELINKLIDFALQTDLQEQLPFSLKFLVTSRPYDTIEEQFKSLSGASTYLRFDGDEKSQKISQEINLVIDAEIPNITGGFNDEDRQCISDRLRMMNNRTYLLLYLTIDIIKRSRSNYRKASNIKNLLSNLPSKFSDAYERILDKSSDKELAQTLLQIIVAATRPLSLTEANIALALAIQQGCCRSHETLDLWPLQNVKSFVQNICGLFVSVHDEKLSLIHQTAREFLIEKKGSSGIHPYEWQGCFDLATTHGTMSKICLCYLQFDDFAEPIHHNEPQNSYQYSQETHHQTEARNKFYPLFDYAALNWMTHYNSQHSGSAKESLASAQTLCNHLLARKFNWLQVYLSSNREWLIFPEWTNFGIASFFGLTYVVEKFLNEETDFNTLGGIRTALHMASYAGHAVVVRMLLDKGANMNAKEVDQTALQLASGNGHEKAVQVLLQYGADANNKDAYSTALELASYAGHDKVVRFLLEKGANPNREGERGSALYLASSKGREEVIRILLENGADVNAQSENYSSALQMAASRGDDKVVRILLENGADINIRDKDHDSALHWASFEGDERVVQILLENGADVNARAKDHDSALHTASRGGHDKVVQMLVENGADVNAQNKNHESALQMASFKGYSQVMRLLFENGADVGRRDMQGRYPIHLASARGYKALVESFSGRMSDLKIIDEQGRNCLHHAACGGFADLVYWLIGKGFDPNAADRDGWTPLHWAAKNGSLDTVETLIRAGAISTIEAIKGWTPYSVATFHHNSLEILLNVTVSSEPTQSGLSTDNVAESLAAAIGSASPGTLQYNKCHGCLLRVIGTLYYCSQCQYPDYCFKCNASSSRTHAGHTFEECLNQDTKNTSSKQIPHNFWSNDQAIHVEEKGYVNEEVQ